MPIVFHPRAAAEAERIETWWRENRNAAPGLFQDELHATLQSLESSPTLGRLVDDDTPQIRRVLMRRTRYHVYYTVRGDTLDVLAVWHAVRGESPRLR